MANFLNITPDATSKPKIMATDTEIQVGIIHDPYWLGAYNFANVISALNANSANVVTWRVDSLNWDWINTKVDVTAPSEDFENNVNVREDASISIGLKFNQSANKGEVASNSFEPLAAAYSYDASGYPQGGVIAIRWANLNYNLPSNMNGFTMNNEDMLGVYGITSLSINITGDEVTASMDAVSYGGLLDGSTPRAILYA